MFIDLYSYGTPLKKGKNGQLICSEEGIDQEVALVNLTTKKRTRLCFCGTACRVEEAKWINDTTIALFGKSEDKIPELLTPCIWVYDINTDILTKFDYSILNTESSKNIYINLNFKKVKFI